MTSLVAAALLAAASVASPHLPQALHISARLGLHDGDQRVEFSITNGSDKVLAFNRAASPCAPYDLAVVVVVGQGGIVDVVERLPLIADTISQTIQVRPHGTYACSFNVSQWFNGKIPQGQQAVLLWSFKPRAPGVFARPLYGGALLLQEPAVQRGPGQERSSKDGQGRPGQSEPR